MQFAFLLPDWPDLHQAAARAETLALADPRDCVFNARRALELAVDWLYRFDRRLTEPYQKTLSARLHEPSFRSTVGPTIAAKTNFLRELGNRAVHTSKAPSDGEARAAMTELFHICFWLARTYARGPRPPDTLAFDPAKLPKPMVQVAKITLDQLRRRETELLARDELLTQTRERLVESEDTRATLEAELQRARDDLATAIATNAAVPDTHDYAEAETRDRFVDILLREAGWDPDAPGTTEYELTGMPTPTGQGRADYVLWGDDGRPLAVVEAKATRHSAQKGQHQAKLYADCLERMTGQRPVIFTTNGYEHFLWDDVAYPPRQVAGFYTKAELALLIQRRATASRLADTPINGDIVERHYQHRALRRIAEHFEIHRQRRALLVMATGAGKTRTAIALTDLLMRAGWAKRVLFLADRTALVKQAAREFTKNLPSVATVSLLDNRAEQDARVYVSTYPTIMGLIDPRTGGQRRFGPGYFDLVIVDEAHRSIYQKYGAIFDYFDSLLVGLTATPRDGIDRNTYRLFQLEDRVPTDAYELQEAVRDGFLVPMRTFTVPTRFMREGIRYDGLSDAEKEEWENAEWEDGEVPDRVEAEALNRWLFNADTVDKVLEHVMTHGQHVAGGDRLAKTIIFAKGHRHAEFIVDRFNIAYPEHAGSFAALIDNQVDHAQSLIDNFSDPAKAPHIAVSVDMLDTGIDVPQIANLVFFKLVRSPTKFWQMVGRGTRLCPDLFGPGQDKQYFSVFDFCQNLEFFNQAPGAAEAPVPESLAARLFRTRLDLLGALDEHATDRALRDDVADRLRREVAAMNIDNFVVRPHRRLVEQFAAAEPWATLPRQARDELAQSLAGLPNALPAEPEEAKRFDLLMLRLQLCTLLPSPDAAALQDRARAIASALEEQRTIPAIAAHLTLIQDMQSDAWWQDVTRPMLEQARRALRLLVPLIDRRSRAPIYTDFADTFGGMSEIPFEGYAPPNNFERFRAKMRYFLRAHEDHVAISKLRLNRSLTATDVAELERMLIEEGGGTPEDLAQARAQCQGLGLFVRSLIGLDRAAAKEAFSDLLVGRTLRPNQIAFLDMLINHLTEHGAVEPGRLYESPYTDMNPGGVEALFTSTDSDRIFTILDDVKARAAA